MNVFGIGLPEMALIFIVALLVFGPKKLPEIGRSLGKAIRSFQDASKEFESEFKREADAIEKTMKEPMKATIEPPEQKAIASSKAAESDEVEVPEAEIAEAPMAEAPVAEAPVAEAPVAEAPAAESADEEQTAPHA